jgi:hypothetical protein
VNCAIDLENHPISVVTPLLQAVAVEKTAPNYFNAGSWPQPSSNPETQMSNVKQGISNDEV